MCPVVSSVRSLDENPMRLTWECAGRVPEVPLCMQRPTFACDHGPARSSARDDGFALTAHEERGATTVAVGATGHVVATTTTGLETIQPSARPLTPRLIAVPSRQCGRRRGATTPLRISQRPAAMITRFPAVSRKASLIGATAGVPRHDAAICASSGLSAAGISVPSEGSPCLEPRQQAPRRSRSTEGRPRGPVDAQPLW